MVTASEEAICQILTNLMIVRALTHRTLILAQGNSCAFVKFITTLFLAWVFILVWQSVARIYRLLKTSWIHPCKMCCDLKLCTSEIQRDLLKLYNGNRFDSWIIQLPSVTYSLCSKTDNTSADFGHNIVWHVQHQHNNLLHRQFLSFVQFFWIFF